MINEINTFSDFISDSISITRVPNRSSVDTLKAESVLFKRVMWLDPVSLATLLVNACLLPDAVLSRSCARSDSTFSGMKDNY